MSSEANNYFTRENLDTYLKELAREYRKRNGKAMPAEIVLIGGAAILANYGFRDMTSDIDALIQAASSMKEAVNSVGDKYGLPNGWLNADFMRTSSYSPKLLECSSYYRTYSNVLTVRTISGEYLIAMKLRSGRKYKNDLSDIIGILAEHEKQGKPISLEMISAAITKLYDGWEQISKDAKDFIYDVISAKNYAELYASVSAQELEAKDILIGFEENYPKAANTDNVDSILKNLTAKRNSRTALLDELKSKKSDD